MDKCIPFAQDSVDEITRLLKELLGGKKFTTVDVREAYHFYPQVRTAQTLHAYGGGDSIQSQTDGNQMALVICDSYTTWTFGTTLRHAHEFDPYAGTPSFEFREGQVIISKGNRKDRRADYLVLAVEE